jgi:hypothetical protein
MISSRDFPASWRAIRIEIVAVVPLKAERTPVPGAGFSPEAVPEKGGANEGGTEPLSHLPGSKQMQHPKRRESNSHPFSSDTKDRMRGQRIAVCIRRRISIGYLAAGDLRWLQQMVGITCTVEGELKQPGDGDDRAET